MKASPRLLVIDNYDSFTYNLVQLLGSLGAELLVYRNDRITADEAESLRPDGLVLSPGPGRPEGAGNSLAILDRLGRQVPTLGVCLGHQCAGALFGGTICHARSLMHGKASRIRHDGRRLFAGLPQGFAAGRYHSLVVDPASLPPSVEVTAWSEDGEVMGLRHRQYPVEGLQFHPESVLTEVGPAILQNYLRWVGGEAR